MAEQTKHKSVTEEEYFALGENVRAEVVNGELIVHMTPNRLDHSTFGYRAITYVDIFVTARDMGRVFGDMTAFKLEPGEEGSLKGARVPDAGYISFERLPREASLHIFPDFSPDLAIEVISDTETFSEVLKKTYDFLDHGTAQVWLILPDLREIRVFTPGSRAGAVFTEDDTLTGGDLLPGFSIPVQAIFDTGNTALHLEVIRRLLG